MQRRRKKAKRRSRAGMLPPNTWAPVDDEEGTKFDEWVKDVVFA